MFKFFRDFIIYGFASIIGKIIALFLMPIYTNTLSKEEYGAMAMIFSIKGIIDLISNLNIHSGIARDYYEKNIDRRKLISTGFFSILSISVFILIISFLSRNYWTDTVLSIPNQKKAFLFMLLSIPTGSLSSYFSILTRFKKKPILFSIGIVIQLLIQVSISLYGVVILKTGISSIFAGLFVGQLFNIIYNYSINREYVAVSFEKKYLIRALKFSTPTLPAILAGWLDSSLGQILVGKYISMAELGIYSVALQLASVFTLFSVALQNVWSPFLYENYQRENFKEEVKKLFFIIVSVLIIIVVFLSLLSKEIILLMSNAHYLNAGKYLILLSIPMSLYLLFPIVTSGISISRDTKYIGIAYVAGSICNLLLLAFLLQTLGVIIVPISLGVSRMVSYFTLYTVTKKKNILVLPNQYILLLIVSMTGLFFINQFNLNLIWRIILIIIFNTSILIKLIKKTDLVNEVQLILKRK